MTSRLPTLEHPAEPGADAGVEPGTDAGVDAGAPPPPEVLFREARRRRRRRQALLGLAALLVVTGAVVAVTLTGGAPQPPPRSTGRAGPGPSSKPTTSGGGAAGSSSYTSVYSLGQADAAVAWMANGDGVYLTTDSGRTWRTVTPPILGKGKPAGEEVGAMAAVGTDDLWLPVITVTGLVPLAESTNGSDRAGGIERSTDGGATWTFTALPGCLQACGAASLSFLDADDGYAAVQVGTGGPSSATRLFATTDGGATWRAVSDVPLDTDGPFAAIAFTTVADGWAVSGPTFAQGTGNVITDRGGRLYRTTDGGATWTTPPGLGDGGRYQLPVFFGEEDGVTVGAAASGSRRPVLFVTRDGGAKWTERRLPPAAVASYSTSTPPSLPFAAVSMDDWVVDVGTSVYATTDGGRTWSHRSSSPATAAGSVSAVAFSSLGDGMAMGMPPGCPAGGAATGRASCYEVLTGTADGGRRWTALHP